MCVKTSTRPVHKYVFVVPVEEQVMEDEEDGGACEEKRPCSSIRQNEP
jgi:hypothetical protein